MLALMFAAHAACVQLLWDDVIDQSKVDTVLLTFCLPSTGVVPVRYRSMFATHPTHEGGCCIHPTYARVSVPKRFWTVDCANDSGFWHSLHSFLPCWLPHA
jgi:hypothetical protein